MALIRCKICGAEISDRAPDCIHCGALIDKGVTNTQTSSTQLLSEQELLQQKITFQQNLSKLKKEKHDVESENARLATEKNTLSQRNYDLQSEKAQLETEKDALLRRNHELEKLFIDSQKAVKTLENKIENTKKAKDIKSSSKKCVRIIGSILRLLVVCFFALGAFVCLLAGKYTLTLWYGSIAVAIAPYVYRMVWKKIKLDKAVKIAIEIVTPVIVAMIATELFF